ncbi:Gfo/Idh/MocA family oxidoreductase [Silicimonas algicola]|uniref:D-galactose 1-dehydrogenase n=1 Tax=Silicimonas algicola TaxID=1826607 RepID=A0A316G106_9RHOB|nr:Gfo/Idh/MocA family oxidoreductase [Silicimonas algicola]AZQ69062.1 Gfo/Idh/MocA family oxidoreductase [Silicimonas algicola]PWK54045.1 D-galactose 1-dehydrogenase [Silicimonas algicola]
MTRRKIALAGIGKIATDQHIPTLASSPDWELAAAVSRHGRVEGVPNFTDMDEMLAAHPEVGTVSLCMPPVPRFAYAEAALKAGRNVMLEKPPGATLSEVHALENLAREAGVVLYATWHSREAAFVAPAAAWLKGRRLKRFTVTWKEDVRKWHPGQDWVFEPGGMGVFDPGINALSIVTAILPDPIHVTRATLEMPENRQTPIAATLAFHHPQGAEVTATMDWDHSGDDVWRIEAVTDGGTMTLDRGGAEMRIDGSVQSAGDGLHGEYPRLYAQMARLVEDGRSDVDLSPARHVWDAMTLGRRKIVAPFHW